MYNPRNLRAPQPAARHNHVQAKFQAGPARAVQSRVIQRLSSEEVCAEVRYWNYKTIWTSFNDEDVASLALMDPDIRDAADTVRLREWLTELGLNRNVPAPVVVSHSPSLSSSPSPKSPALIPLPSKKSVLDDSATRVKPRKKEKRDKSAKEGSHGYKPLDLSKSSGVPSVKSSVKMSPSHAASSSSVAVLEEFPALPSLPSSLSPSTSQGPALSLEQQILNSFVFAKPPSQAVPVVDLYAGLSPVARQLAQIIEADRTTGTSSARYKNSTPGQNGTLNNYGSATTYSVAVLNEVGVWWGGRSVAYEYVPPGPKDYNAHHNVANFLFHPGGASFNWHGQQTGAKG